MSTAAIVLDGRREPFRYHPPYAQTFLRKDASLFRDDQDDGTVAEVAVDVARARGIPAAEAYDAIDSAFFGSRGSTEAEQLTWRTLGDIDDTPPADLLLGMLEPDGPSLFYGAGGVGKGSSCAYFIRELLKVGMKPMIYDAENRPKEWARRTSGLGVNRSQVVYLQPKDLPPALMGQPLWLVVSHLGKILKAAGSDVLFIDSILAGMNISEEALKSDAGAPYRYVAAVDSLGVPSVSLGHTPKGQSEGEPFGSVSWTNAMRMTWLGTPGEGEGHRVRWKLRKKNERGHVPPVLLTFQYESNTLAGVTRENDEEVTRSWLMQALYEQPRTVEELAEELCEEGDDFGPGAADRAKARIRQALNRMRKDKVVNKPNKRGAPWALAID